MGKIQIKKIEIELYSNPEDNSSGTNKFSAPFDFDTLADKAKDVLLNKAIYHVLTRGQYKKYWLPSDKLFQSIGLSKTSIEEFRNFYQPAWDNLKEDITFNEIELFEDPAQPDFVRISGICIFKSSDTIWEYISNSYDEFITDNQEKPPVVEEPEPDLEIKSETSNEPTHIVSLINKSHFLALRDEASKEDIREIDVYTGTGESSVELKYPVQAGSLGGLVGLLPHGTKVRVELPGWADGSPGAWDLVKIIEGPPPTVADGVSNLDANLIGTTAFVHSFGLSPLPTQPTVEEIIAAAGSPEILSEEDLEKVAAVKEHINPPLIDISSNEVNPYVAAANVGPQQDWTRRTPFEVFKNKAERRYEIVVELDFFPEVAYEEEGTEDPKVYKEAKRNEARKQGLKALLKYFNRVSDEAYILKLLNRGQGEVAQIEGYWADDNPNNRKIYYLIAVPSSGAGSFNYKSHPPAETLTIKEMVVERVIDFQYVFMTNKIEKQVSETIKILKDTIKPGLDSYSGLIKNKPDVDFEIKKLESFVPAIKEILSENNVKFRADKEDQIEMGLDTDLNVVYVRFGPEDGKDGNWKIVAPWTGGN